MEDLIAIQGKSIEEVRQIANVFGITDENLTKEEYIERIVAISGEGGKATEEPKKRGRRPRVAGIKVVAATPTESNNEATAEEPAAEEAKSAEEAPATPQPAPKNRESSISFSCTDLLVGTKCDSVEQYTKKHEKYQEKAAKSS